MRTQNWEQLLAAFVETRSTQPFAWGTNDCCIMAADWALLLTDKDPAASRRGSYDTALGAARAYRDAGGVVALADHELAALGWYQVPVAYAQRGDIVAVDLDPAQGPALGVCHGTHAIFAGGCSAPTLSASIAWHHS